MTDKNIKRYLAEIGSKGGKAAARKMSKAERVRRALKGVRARAAKARKRKG